ncbi:MAG TPA: tripartite tricarboxylate transporter substrate binding protein [Ramlibacter sp.]
MTNRRTLLKAAALLPFAPAALAQPAPGFPTRAVMWVVPYPAGGFGDALSRMLAQKLAASLKQPVVVENKPGAGGQIAAAWVKQQPADGHTLFYGDLGPFAMNAGLYPNLNYDTLKDFAPLTRLLESPTLVIVPPTSRLRTWQDLVQASRSDKGLNYGSYGVGSHPHIWTEMLQREVKGNFTHVSYKGGAPAVADLMAGHIDMMLDVAPSSIPLVREGKVRALAVVGSAKRLQQLPQVPTMTELGLAGLDIPGWTGVVVRAGTPEPIVQLLHAEVVKALQSPDVVQRYTELGLTVAPNSRAEFTSLIRSETSRWGGVIRSAGVKID